MSKEPENWSTYFGPTLPPVLDYSILCFILEWSQNVWGKQNLHNPKINFLRGRAFGQQCPNIEERETSPLSSVIAAPLPLTFGQFHIVNMNKGTSTGTSSTRRVVCTVGCFRRRNNTFFHKTGRRNPPVGHHASAFRLV